MRNVLPLLSSVQVLGTSLAGSLGRISREAMYDTFYANSANSLTLPQMEPYGPITRYIFIISRERTSRVSLECYIRTIDRGSSRN
jgi:hypothetical protein